ncbi:MAG: amidohydrolase family protein [Saprospiraceae bacterium]
MPMKKSAALLLGIAILCAACQSNNTFFKDTLCIKNITIIDPEDGAKKSQTVLIKDGKILQITPSKELVLSSKNTVVDGTGKYLIPGLWDAHVHFAYIEEMAPVMFDLFLAYGITSVRDTGGEIDFVKQWKDKAQADPLNTPRVMIAGPLLDGMPNVYDGSDIGHPPLSVGLKTVDDVVRKIEELDAQGVDLLKAYEMLTPEQFSKVAALGKVKGLKVTGHVPLSMDVISASNAGLNSMEHLRNLELSCAFNADELLAQRKKLLALGKDDTGAILRTRIHQTQRPDAINNFDETQANKVLQVLAKNQTWQIPTLALNTGFVKKPFAKPGWDADFQYFPGVIGQQWATEIANVQQAEMTAFRIQQNDYMLDMVSRIHEAGIPIMAGTDTPIFYLTPGRSLHEELAVLVEAGLSPLETLKTATTNPALYFELEDELGRIKENYWADLLILDANPLENINNTLRINAVIKQGQYLDRSAILDRLKARVK